MKIGIIVVAILFLLLFGGTSYYIGFNLYQIASLYLPKAICYILEAVILAASVVFVLRFIIIFCPGLKTTKCLVNWFSSYWMGIYLYLLLFFILADMILLLGRLTGVFSSPVPDSVQISVKITAVCISVGMIIYGIYHAGKIETVSYEIQLSENRNEKDEEFNLVLISDLHLGAVTSEQKLTSIVDRINQMQPDIICIAGDIFDTDFDTIKDPDKAAESMRQLKAKYGVFCCLGNHDAGVTFDKMEDFLKKCNICCLNEEYVTIDDRILLLGRVDSVPIGVQGSHVRTDTTKLLQSIEKNNLPLVVMDHNPANLSQYTPKADLILCGHTHHGQIWPANWVTAYGYYPMKNGVPQTIITSGVGVWGMPMRIGSGCEIAQVRLRE